MHRTNHSPANLNWAHCHSSHDFSDDENQDRASKCGSNSAPMDPVTANPVMRLPCKNSSATWKNPPNTTWLPSLSRGLLQEKHQKTQHSSTVQDTTADKIKNCRNNQQSCGDGKQYIGLSESMVPLCALVHHVFRIRLLFGEQLRYFQTPQKPSFIDYIPTFVSG